MKKKYIVLCFVIFVILIKAYVFSHKYVSEDESKERLIFIEEIKEKSSDKISYYVRVGNNFKDKFILNIYSDKYSKENKDILCYSHFKYGDVIKVKGKIIVPELLNNPYEFNYKRYLYSNNIYGTISTYSSVNKVDYSLNFIQEFTKNVYLYKENIENNIKEVFLQDSDLVLSLVLGDKANLDEVIKDKFQNIGVSHILSVSGTHILSFMYVINIFLLEKKKSNKNIFKSIIKIICIILYMFITGFSVSCTRAGIMLIISIIQKQVGNKYNPLQALKISAILNIIYKPYCIFSLSFVLSYLAAFGIICYKKYIVKGITEKIKFKNKVIKYIIDVISITISVKILILPIEICSFNKISIPIILPNLLIGLITVPIRILGIFGCIFSFVPKISLLVFSLLIPITNFLKYIVDVLNKFVLNINTMDLGCLFYLLYYFLVSQIYVILRLKFAIKTKRKNSKYNLENLLKKIKIIFVGILLLLIIFVFVINIYSKYFTKYVYYFNVKQGEMSYVKYNNESVMVDIGSLTDNLAFNVINNYFKAKNISKVNLLVLSHMDKDHINGLEELVKNYKVELIIYSKCDEKSKSYIEFKQIVNRYNLNCMKVYAGDTINLNDINICVLSPSKVEKNTLKDSNSNSLVCFIKTKNKKLLYMGDATVSTEKNIMKNNKNKLNIDILKVGHHGSKTSSCEEFIKYTNAKFAVISAYSNYYGHPHESTLDTLKTYKIMTYLTQNEGAMKFNLN